MGALGRVVSFVLCRYRHRSSQMASLMGKARDSGKRVMASEFKEVRLESTPVTTSGGDYSIELVWTTEKLFDLEGWT